MHAFHSYSHACVASSIPIHAKPTKHDSSPLALCRFPSLPNDFVEARLHHKAKKIATYMRNPPNIAH
jgi:hypothetical protein